MNLDYFRMINNTYKSQSKQETDLYLLNRHIDECFADTIDYHVVKKNGEPFELLIIKDTDGNTFKKKIKAKHSTPFNLGDYIEWNGQIWLITLVDSNEKTYHSGYMYLCTVPLRWQNSEGKLIERYAYSEDFTKYSSGTTGNNTITIGDNQYGLTLPIDSETRKLKRDMRFPIDFEDAEQPDIYQLTNRKVNLNNNEYFGRGGTMVVTMSYVAFNKDKDKRVIMENGDEVWICDYIDVSSPHKLSLQESKLDYDLTILGNQILKIGFSRKYAVNLVSKNGEVLNVNDHQVEWKIISDFDIRSTINGNTIELYTDNISLIGSCFLIQASIKDAFAQAQLAVTIERGL